MNHRFTQFSSPLSHNKDTSHQSVLSPPNNKNNTVRTKPTTCPNTSPSIHQAQPTPRPVKFHTRTARRHLLLRAHERDSLAGRRNKLTHRWKERFKRAGRTQRGRDLSRGQAKPAARRYLCIPTPPPSPPLPNPTARRSRRSYRRDLWRPIAPGEFELLFFTAGGEGAARYISASRARRDVGCFFGFTRSSGSSFSPEGRGTARGWIAVFVMVPGEVWYWLLVDCSRCGGSCKRADLGSLSAVRASLLSVYFVEYLSIFWNGGCGFSGVFVSAVEAELLLIRIHANEF